MPSPSAGFANIDRACAGRRGVSEPGALQVALLQQQVDVASVRQIGIELFTTHAFAFEVTSVLILVAMVGAVVLAKRNL